MRRHYSTKDDKTGRTLVLSEASYDEALGWLQREQEKFGREIYRCENCNTNHMEIYTGKPKVGLDVNGNKDMWYCNNVMFYYDEERGYLLQE